MNGQTQKRVAAGSTIGALVLALGGNVVQYLEHREHQKTARARIEQAREREQSCLTAFLRIDAQHDKALAACYERCRE